MTFVHVNNEAADDEFELIVAMNRDEFYDRRTIPARKWTSNPSIISGQLATSILHLNCTFGSQLLLLFTGVDLSAKNDKRWGRTWFGISTTRSRIASMLHIDQPFETDRTKKHRGG